MATRNGKGEPTEASQAEGSQPAGRGPSATLLRSKAKKRAWGEVFLTTLANTGVIRVACVAAGIHFTTAYDHRAKDAEFAEAWDSALEEACDALEAEARRRAVVGTERPVFYKGQKCGAIREYSDVLLIFLLKAARPEKYREHFDLRKILAALPEPAAGPAKDD